MSEANQLFITYAQRLAARLAQEIDHDVLEAFNDTNIGLISDALAFDMSPAPTIHHTDDDGLDHYELDSGTIVGADLISAYSDSVCNTLRLQFISGMDACFVHGLDLNQVCGALEHEFTNGEDKTFSLSACFTSFPYDTTMMYFSARYMKYEADPAKHGAIMRQVEEQLAEFELEDELLLEGLDEEEIAGLLQAWAQLEQQIDFSLRPKVAVPAGQSQQMQ